MARSAVRGTFSQPGPSHPAAAGRLARTLGIRKRHMCYSNRKCAYRRELNSHEAAKSELPSGAGIWLGAAGPTGRPSKANSLILVGAGVNPDQSERTRTPQEAAKWTQQRAFGKSFGPRMSTAQEDSNRASWASARNQGHEHKAVVRAARRAAPCEPFASAADAEYRDCSFGGAEREAESRSYEMHSGCQPRKLMPNPSLKRSANGRPPAPGRWYAVHFHRPGAGVLPSSPA